LLCMLFCSFAFAEENIIKIGVNSSLTGPSSMWGISELNALELEISPIDFLYGNKQELLSRLI